MTDAAARHLARFVEEVAREAVREALHELGHLGSDQPIVIEPEWLSTRAAADLARRKPDTVRRWVRDGHIEYRNVGGSVGYEISRASLLAYLSSRGLSG